ncbi:MAG: nicotinate phosphoribosyltransferase [Candidatus Omnitrophica bacterium]|nr:nicotinate phosphoribosyltransferase [Candidatus Omnitrophota bacterium]
MAAFNHSNLSLLMDLYELTMAQSYYRHRFKAQATFDLFVRHLPANRSYLLFAGLEDVLRYLKNLKFNQEDLDYLERLGFGEDFLTYLGRLRFHGDVWAMPEGTVFFPGEPVIRVTGSLIESQIIESFLLNAVNLSTMVATKASRIVAAADGRGAYDFSLRRTQGIDAALKVARSAFIAGFSGTSNVLASKLYGIPAVGTMAHSFVLSFSSEAESFRAFFETFPNKSILLVDTYSIQEGIKNAIRVAEEFRAKGHMLQGIRLDSGNLAQQAKMARRMLDENDFREVKIFASGDLDEYKIDKLVASKAPIDDFGVGTRMGASADAPSLDVVYKIAEVTNEGGVFLPTMKFSINKVTLPGRKQIFRRFDKRGFCIEDIIGLEHEKPGEPLLKNVMRAGEIVYNFRPPSEIKDRAAQGLSSLKKEYRLLRHGAAYPVVLSKDLNKLIRGLERHLKKP